MPTGRCLCADVAWEIDGPLRWMAHCHCSMCRKAHGVAYATFVTFDAGDLRWLRGEDGIARYASSPGSSRTFCGRCGSKLPSLEPFAYAPAGALEGELGVRPSAHLFVGSKAPWHTITDGLEQHHDFPAPGGQAVPDRRRTEPVAGEVRGACLCGAVAYALDGPLEGGAIVSCHCLRCRRARAAAHASNLFVDPARFRFLRGTEQLSWFKLPEAARFGQSFCRICGSPMPVDAVLTGRRMIPAGSLEDDPGVRAGLSIFVGSKAAWHTPTGPAPQHHTYPESGFPPVARPRSTLDA